ncbi:MAG: tetratricopeptide repeat protein [Planctomycetes bacterium]|nr:tetratricopeptide repeat protein [Planctomycetota bacterium]
MFSARQLSLGRRVAVKVLQRHLTMSPSTIARFRREAKTIAALDHPGIVRVLAVGIDRDTYWFAMEFVQGCSLAHHITALQEKQESPGPWTRRMVQLAANVADALHHVHELGIVHRDVKPSNILLREDGSPVLTDFGLAHDAHAPSITMTGGRTGTPCYMAPEQISGADDEIDARTDVFALGASLYEMLTLERAFDGPTPDAVMRRVIDDEPLDARKRNVAVSRDLASIVATALDKDPGRRYQTAAALAEDLRAWLTHRPVAARRTGTLQRTVRWARRQPWKAGFAGAVALGVPALAAMVAFAIARAPLVRAGERQHLEELIERGYHYGAHSHRDYPKAKQALDEALTIAPEDPDVLVATTLMLMRWGDGGAAAALEFLASRPASARHREVARAECLLFEALGRHDDAGALEARLGPPRNATEHYLAGYTEQIRGENVSPPDREALLRALKHFSLASRLATRPRLAFLLCYAGMADALDDRAAREEAITTLTTLWPESSRAWGASAWILRNVDPPRARIAVERALELYPDEPGLLYYRGCIRERLGDFDGAVADHERALSIQPDMPGARQAIDRLRLLPR